MPTPGHAADHVCFVRERVCFCGDLILGEGSTIVPPAAGGGSLADYMASLRRVAELDVDVLAPGHGPLINDPAAKIAEYVEHRESRERRLLAALDAGERSRAALLATVWDDVPEPLRPAAAIAMQAHLEKLAAEGRASTRLAPSARWRPWSAVDDCADDEPPRPDRPQSRPSSSSCSNRSGS